MLQYALPKAPESFSRTSSVFAEPPSRTQPSSNSLDSRRPSTTSQHSTEQSHKRSFEASSQGSASSAQAEAQLQHLPALSALASLAASAPAATMNPPSANGDRYVEYDIHEEGEYNTQVEVRCGGGLDGFCQVLQALLAPQARPGCFLISSFGQKICLPWSALLRASSPPTPPQVLMSRAAALARLLPAMPVI